MSKTMYMFGCDPEFFLASRKTGAFVAAAGMFPGTKDEPFKLEDGAVQVDGLALEFNIDATDSPDVFQKRVNRVLEQVYDMMSDVDKDLEAKFIPFAEFRKEYFDGLPDDCKILGCDPDFDSTGSTRAGPRDLMNRPFRTAAGHLHIGWDSGLNPQDPAHFEDCLYVAKAFGSCPDQDYSEENGIRKNYYGGHCAFRPKTYGVELRSYSNRWVTAPNGPRNTVIAAQKRMAMVEKGFF